MNAKWTARIVAGTILIVLSGQAMAQMGGGAPGPGRGPTHEPGSGMMGMGLGGPLGFAAAQLNLTDEQKQAIRTVCQQSRANADEIVEAIDAARASLHEAVIGGVDETQIRAAAATLGIAIGNQAALQAQTVAAVKALLTEEQRKEYEKMRAGVPHSREGVRGRGFGGGRGLQAHGPEGLGAQGRPPAHSAVPGAGPGTVEHTSVEQMFKAADGNKDGVLSMEELKAFQGAGRGGWGFGRQ